MAKYVDMVYSAGLRQTNDRALAEDVTQAVFVLLARKAPSLSEQTLLPGWLFRTTRHVALTAIRTEQRRRRRELAAAEMNVDSPESNRWEDLAPVLDEALAQLGETDRNALLLRYFNHKSLEEVGQCLGVSEEAAKKRVARAVDRLRQSVGKLGWTSSATALAAMLAARSVQSAPADFVARILDRGFLSRGSAAASALLLVKEAMRRSVMAKVKLALGLIVGLLPLVFLGPVAVDFWEGERDVSRPGAVAALPALPERALAALPVNQTLTRVSIPLRIVAAEDGRALPRVAVEVSFHGATEGKVRLSTDRDGRCRIPLAGRLFRSISALAAAAEFASRRLIWFRYELESQNEVEEYVLRLDRGRMAAGLVQDERGQGVARAQVRFLGPELDTGTREQFGETATETDGDGRWTCDQIPSGVEALVAVIEHPDFLVAQAHLPLARSDAPPPVFVLRRGVSVAGVVRTEAGRPISGARVTDERIGSPSPDLSTTTDEEGRFYFPQVAPGNVRWKVRATGYGETIHEHECSTNTEDVQLLLKPALAGKGDPKREPESKAVRLVATVEDEATGKPIPRFAVLLGPTILAQSDPVPSLTRLDGQPQFLGESRNGTLDWNWPGISMLHQFKLEIRALGYAPALSDFIRADAPEQTLHFRLQSNGVIAGLLVTRDGKAASGAIVQLAGPSMLPTIERRTNAPLGLIVRATGPAETQFVSNEEGKFSFRPVAGLDRVIVLHPEGCRALSFDEAAGSRIVLRPWSGVEGDVRVGSLAGANQEVQIETCRADRSEPYIPFRGSGRSDEQGRFVFDRVPPGAYRIFRRLRLGDHPTDPTVLSYNTELDVRSGEVARVIIGGNGRQVTGRLRTVPDDRVRDWNSNFQLLAGQGSEDPGQEARSGLNAFCFLFNYYLEIEPDGEFVVQDVPPGRYRLEIRLTEPLQNLPEDNSGVRPRRQLGEVIVEIAVPEAADAHAADPVDLGVITVPLKE